MKLEFKKQNKKAKVAFSHSKWSIMHPEKHWHITLYGSVFLIFFSIIFSAYLFWQEYQAIKEITFDNGKVEVDTVNQEHIRKILEMFSDREEKRTEIISGFPLISDPSI